MSKIEKKIKFFNVIEIRFFIKFEFLSIISGELWVFNVPTLGDNTIWPWILLTNYFNTIKQFVIKIIYGKCDKISFDKKYIYRLIFAFYQ